MASEETEAENKVVRVIRMKKLKNGNCGVCLWGLEVKNMTKTIIWRSGDQAAFAEVMLASKRNIAVPIFWCGRWWSQRERTVEN